MMERKNDRRRGERGRINQHGFYGKPGEIASLRSQNPYIYYALNKIKII